MAVKTLAVKYRPKTWDEVSEQSSTKIILQQQLDSGEVKNAYLFCGPAGCGKTTCARIFANDINKGEGNPIELDAASNNGVDDVRNIIQQAKTKSINSEYKIFIIDECHALSNSAWQAMLKIIEEPPAKSIFIFCTTDPQKIPKTILSRVQRYDFHRMSQLGVIRRLNDILDTEAEQSGQILSGSSDRDNAIEFIARLADGGMRDAITFLDKCLAYHPKLTLKHVTEALGTADYSTMFELTDCLLGYDGMGSKEAVEIIETLHANGKELKTFVKQYIQFLLDLDKYSLGCDWKYLQMPKLTDYEKALESYGEEEWDEIHRWLSIFVQLNADIKWSQSAKYDIEAVILVNMENKG